MKINIKIIGILFLLSAFTGCIKEGLEECPANVRVNIFVEKFQNKSQDPLADTEEIFNSRVSHLRYYLYKDNELVSEVTKNDFSDVTGSYYSLNFSSLNPGNYHLVLVANSSKDALQGDCVKADNLCLSFPGCSDTEDYFSAILPFTVQPDAVQEFDVGLLRTQGMIRFIFNNLPSHITAFEMTIQNISSEKWITGDYKSSCEANHKYSVVTVDTDDSPYRMWVFPTISDSQSAYRLMLHSESKARPPLAEDLSGNIFITRNQLVDVVLTFEGENIVDIEIILDAAWDGTTPGGNIDID